MTLEYLVVCTKLTALEVSMVIVTVVRFGVLASAATNISAGIIRSDTVTSAWLITSLVPIVRLSFGCLVSVLFAT